MDQVIHVKTFPFFTEPRSLRGRSLGEGRYVNTPNFRLQKIARLVPTSLRRTRFSEVSAIHPANWNYKDPPSRVKRNKGRAAKKIYRDGRMSFQGRTDTSSFLQSSVIVVPRYSSPISPTHTVS